MAVQDKYVESSIVAGKKAAAALAKGAQVFAVCATVETAAADDDGSVFRMFKGLPGNLIPLRIDVLHDSITAGTDYDVGFHKTDLGAVIDKDALADGLDLSTAGSKDGLTTVDKANRCKKIYELAGHSDSTQLPAYDLTITGNTVGSAAGTITVIALFAQG